MTFQTNDGTTFMTATVIGRTPVLNGKVIVQKGEAARTAKVTRDLLHQRLGHIGKDRLERMVKQGLATGYTLDTASEHKDLCEHCIAGKLHRDPFPQLTPNRSGQLLGRIHSDLHGPLPAGLRCVQEVCGRS